MTDPNPPPPSRPGDGPVAAERIGRLDPVELALVELAVEALRDGRLAAADAWDRYTATAIELLASVRAGRLDVHAAHDLALAAALEAP